MTTTLTSFSEAVAQRSRVPVATVDVTLERFGIDPTPAPPTARQLRVREVAFAGTRPQEDKSEKFSFDWKLDRDGLWALTAERNSVGKSSVLQVVLWALRGTPKHLADDVRSWLQSVSVSFEATRLVVVSFTLSEGRPNGTVSLGSGDSITTHSFGSDAEFRHIMQDVMLSSLDLEKIPGSHEQAPGDVRDVEHGWTAYTGAFIADAHSDAIIGQMRPGLTPHLLQVFLGLPWAVTTFRADAAVRVAGQRLDQHKKRLAFLGGRSLNDIRMQLRDVEAKIASDSVQESSQREYARAQQRFQDSLQPLHNAHARLTEAEEMRDAAMSSRIQLQRQELRLKQGHAASAFLWRLDPKCCPHCSQSIDEERRHRESAEHICQVCSRPLSTGVLQNVQEVLLELSSAIIKARRAEREAIDQVDVARRDYEAARQDRRSLAEQVRSLETFGTVLDAQEMRVERERLLTLANAAEAVLGELVADEATLTILDAALAEARSRIEASAAPILQAVNDEIATLLPSIGMPVVRVDLKRNAHVDVYQPGDIKTPFGRLTKGQQLRLRIATVAALVRTAKKFGAGRHPGLLLIDSPGNEEMTDADVQEILAQLRLLTSETPDLQILLATARQAIVEKVVPSERIKGPMLGGALF